MSELLCESHLICGTSVRIPWITCWLLGYPALRRYRLDSPTSQAFQSRSSVTGVEPASSPATLKLLFVFKFSSCAITICARAGIFSRIPRGASWLSPYLFTTRTFFQLRGHVPSSHYVTEASHVILCGRVFVPFCSLRNLRHIPGDEGDIPF